MTKITILNSQLNLLMKNIAEIKSFETLTVSEFKAYKKLISRRDFVKQKILFYENLKQKTETTYNSKNVKWLYDDSLNCRQYCRLEKYANYKKERKLYKLGYLPNKPLFPLLKSIKEHVEFYYLEPLNEKKQVLKDKFESYWNSTKQKSPTYQNIKKIQYYKNAVLPQKLNRLAINKTKKIISGYRKFKNNTHCFSRALSYSPVIQILNGFYCEAKKELDTTAPNSFKSRIMVQPINHTTSSMYSQKINNSNDFDLAL